MPGAGIDNAAPAVVGQAVDVPQLGAAGQAGGALAQGLAGQQQGGLRCRLVLGSPAALDGDGHIGVDALTGGVQGGGVRQGGRLGAGGSVQQGQGEEGRGGRKAQMPAAHALSFVRGSANPVQTGCGQVARMMPTVMQATARIMKKRCSSPASSSAKPGKATCTCGPNRSWWKRRMPALPASKP